MTNILDGKYIKNGSITASKLSGVILNDIGSPTSPYNFGNQDLKNVSSLLIGSNTASGYNTAIRNIQPIVNFLGADKGHMCLENGYTYAGNQDKYLAIDFQPQLNWGKPTARIACQNTDSGSFLVLGTSDIFADGITKICATFAKFYTENTTGIKVNESVLFENSGGVIGNSTAYPDDITLLNSPTIMSDPRLKAIDEKKIDFDFDFLEKIVDSIIFWKWKPKKIEAKRKTKLVKNEILNKKTKLIETQYDFITEITEEEKIKEHSSSHIGFDLSKFYKFFTESGFRTKDFNFFRIAATYKKLEINPETLEEKEIEISSFDENGDPILDKNGSPFGAMSYKPTELQPLAFMYINKLHEKIKSQDKRLDDLEKQIKILLKK